jgi:iron complex transport system ATP-binding protein
MTSRHRQTRLSASNPSLSLAAITAGNRQPVLSAEGLSFGYHRQEPLIQGLSATLAPGRVCVVLGPNAAGKSTLLKLLLGQLTPWQGRITLAGHDLASITAGHRAGLLSYVPQRGGTSFAFTVRQVVQMGRFALARQPEAADQALAMCDLSALSQRIYSELSVGQQQRVLLARAIAQSRGKGRLMLLDEPGSAMDLRHVHAMMATLQQLARTGLGILLVLHDLNLAARYADDIWLMDRGAMKAAGPWDAVLEPELLSDVYQMKLTRMMLPNQPRPMFTAAHAQYTQDTPAAP